MAQIERQALVASPRARPGGSAGLPTVATDAGSKEPTRASLQRSTGCGTEAKVDKAATSDQRAVDGTASGKARCGRIGSRRHLPSHAPRSEEHTSELQSRPHLVCRLLLEK